MCWMEDPKPLVTVSFPTCDGCGKTFAQRELHEYDMFRDWGELAEWIEHKTRILMLCMLCVTAMDNYRDRLREHVRETEPSGWTIPENGMPVSRYIDRSGGTIPVGTHNVAYETTLGIHCAKQHYGVDATDEILMGFVYHDDQGHVVRRLTVEDVDETTRCDKCWLRLYECNAREVTR